MPVTRRMSATGGSVTPTEVLSPTRRRGRPRATPSILPTPNIDVFSEDEEDDNGIMAEAAAAPEAHMANMLNLSRLAFTLSAVIVALGAKVMRKIKAATPDKINSPEGMVIVAMAVLWLLVMASFGSGSSSTSALSGVLLALDGARNAVVSLWEGDRHGRTWETNPHQQATIDYDQLAEELVTSDKFQQMVRDLTRKQLSTLEDDIIASKDQQMDAVRKLVLRWEEEKDAQAEEILSLTKDVEGLKLNLENRSKQELTDLDAALKAKLNQERDKLQAAIAQLRQEMASKSTEPVTANVEQDTATNEAVAQLEQRIEAVQQAHASVKQQLTKCCQQQQNVASTVESVFKDWLSAVTSNDDSHSGSREFRAWLAANYVTKDQFELRVASLLQTMKIEVREDVAEHIAVEARKRAQESAEEAVRTFAMKHGDDIIATEASRSGFAVNIGAKQGLDVTSEAEISRIVQDALRKYDADKTGMFDFALESAGGTIASTRCTETHDVTNAIYSVLGIPFWWERNNPRTILQPGASPGQCWAFKGSHGRVVVRLSGRVHVQAVSLEHIPRMSAPDGSITSAPRDFAVYGLTSLEDEQPALLGNFTYVDGNQPVQTYYTPDAENNAFNLIELKVLSNHGHPVYTCLYRFRVHGKMGKED